MKILYVKALNSWKLFVIIKKYRFIDLFMSRKYKNYLSEYFY